MGSQLLSLTCDLRQHLPLVARSAAAVYLAVLAMLCMTAWQTLEALPDAAVARLPSLQLLLLMGAGTLPALFTLAASGIKHGQNVLAVRAGPPHGMGELLAQMNHELRTPLNAVIGFSEVMVRELHGPLGHERYQEYARHISTSGGRLLRSSENALAITEAMTALMGEGLASRSEKLTIGPVIREAWRRATADLTNPAPRLSLSGIEKCEVFAEQAATVQALEHLFRQALICRSTSRAINVSTKRQQGADIVAIHATEAISDGGEPGSLHLAIAKALLSAQGAVLRNGPSGEDTWSATIEFRPS
jgi:signal transduction histidine kinase